MFLTIFCRNTTIPAKPSSRGYKYDLNSCSYPVGVPDQVEARNAASGHGFSPARIHYLGVALLLLALTLLVLGSWLLFIPLAALALLVLAAPFWPRAQLFLPIVCHGPRRGGKVALTFDDGPDPETTPKLLDLLDKHSVSAAFFIIGDKAEAHPDLIKAILARGHEIGNHSQTHDPILMLRRKRTLLKQIEACQKTLVRFGIAPLAFRPPVGITNPRLRPVMKRLGMYIVVFDCAGRDVGNRRVQGLADRILLRVRPGSIIVFHDRRPAEGIAVEEWLGEVETVIRGVKNRGLQTVLLSELIGRPVMELFRNGPNPSNTES
ncbi:MAG: polysaccharide deacetylase family protein [Proteobacteria bacterium]|nr:polysaccharide deacetylase family protein [Pseudomonadota bacterium]MBU1740069.1 polysaccharide deacetylase family protein [Pseudomonadota bacterium]